MPALVGANPLLGHLSMDLLYILDTVLLAIIYLALRRHGESTMLIATTLGMLGIAAYSASNPAFEVQYLSGAYGSAMGAEERGAILAAAAVLMVIPSSVPVLGIYFSLASLAPWLVWLVAVALRFRAFVGERGLSPAESRGA